MLPYDRLFDTLLCITHNLRLNISHVNVFNLINYINVKKIGRLIDSRK